MTNRLFTGILFLIICTQNLHAVNLDRGFKQLKKGNKEKAEELLLEALNEREFFVAPQYGLSLLYKDPSFHKYSLDKAYEYIKKALDALHEKYAHEMTHLKRVGAREKDLISVKQELERKILSSYIKSNDLEKIEAYIAKAKDAHNLNRAIQVRDQIHYKEVMEIGTVEAYNDFLSSYPNALQFSVVKIVRDEKAFQEAEKLGTASAYAEFIEKYPDALQVTQALNSKNDKSYIELLEKQKEVAKITKEKTELETKFITAERDQLKRISEEQLKVNKEQRKRNIYLSIVGFIIFLLLIVSVISYRKIKSINSKIEHQKVEIETKNKHIMDSISYAKYIQDAILPKTEVLKSYFSDSFIFYKPRDIVSGDFYWFTEVNQKLIVVAADCTGHGVPGALMSMIGTTLLNQIVLIKGITQPNEILFELRKEVIKVLDQKETDEGAKDGMDMALISFDKDNQTIDYAGAFNPLYLVKNEKLVQIKADRQPVASYYKKNEKSFTNHSIDVEKGQYIYMFSDGFVDQFGGEFDKKFSGKAYRKLLEEISTKDGKEQERLLEKTILNWKGKNEFIDDMLIIGLKV